MVTVIDHTIYVDYFSSSAVYYIRHSTSATNHKGHYMACTYGNSGYSNGVSAMPTKTDNCKFYIKPVGTNRNQCYLQTGIQLANAYRYINASATNVGQVGYGSGATAYTIERMPDGTFGIYLTSNAANHYLTNDATTYVKFGAKDSPDAHWYITDGVDFTTTFTFTTETGIQITGTATDNIPNYTVGGLDGATLSNVVVAKNATTGNVTYTADIAFPFPLSSATETHWTYLGFEPSGIHCHVYTKANSTSVFGLNPNSTSPRTGVATNQAGDQDYFLWKFVPTFADGALTFKIYNKAAAKYIQTATPGANDDAVTVSLVEAESDATPFTYAHTTVTNANGFGFWHSDGVHMLQIDGSGVNSEQTMRMLKKSAHAAHKGFNTDFDAPYDFDALMAALRARSEMNTALEALIGTGVNHYTAPSNWQGQKNAVASVLNGTLYWSGVQFAAGMDVFKLTLNEPTAGFYRFKSPATQRYLSVGTPDTPLGTATEADASTILYYTGVHNGQANISAYDKGYWISQGNTARLGGGGSQYLFAAAPELCYKPVDGSDGVPCQYTLQYNGAIYVLDRGGESLESTTDVERQLGWLLEPVTELPLTIPASGYTTFSCPLPTTLPEGWTAYAVTQINDASVHLEPLTGNIPANTGVIIAGEGTANLTVAAEATVLADNVLQPNITVAQHTAAAGHYFLATLDNQTGFYRNAADGYLLGHKAYLAPASNVKAFLGFDAGAATALDALLTPAPQAQIYDLQGRRLTTLQKGVNIVNGKKIIVK